MKSKFTKSILLAILFFFFVSWFYKTIVLILLVLVWRKELKSLRKWSVKAVMGVLFIALFCVMPRYRYNTSDRVRLIYQDENYTPVMPPIHHYLINLFLPEEEICNLGVWGARIIPKSMFPFAGWLLDEFKYEYNRGNTGKFLHPYRMLNRRGLYPMSGTTSQVCNMMGIDDTRSVYLITPQNYDENKTYPVVFFMHGYLGNWKNYTGVLQDIKDCIVLCVGTKDWSGIYSSNDIKELLNKQISFLERLGYKVDTKNLHLIGLSNGGSASNVVYQSFSSKFKSIAFVSTGIHQTYPISSKVLLIGGGKDHSSSSLPSAYQVLKMNGTQVDMYWGKEESHFVLLSKLYDVTTFLNKHYTILN